MVADPVRAECVRLATEEAETQRAIAARLGVHRTTVQRWLRADREQAQMTKLPGGPRARLAAARSHVRATMGTGMTSLYAIDPAVIITFARPDEERQAALEYVLGQERHADEIDPEFGPLYLGWALFQAFLSGIDFARGDS